MSNLLFNWSGDNFDVLLAHFGVVYVAKQHYKGTYMLLALLDQVFRFNPYDERYKMRPSPFLSMMLFATSALSAPG
jgi:hypothetical protein